jgi:hypothetical protein
MVKWLRLLGPGTAALAIATTSSAAPDSSPLPCASASKPSVARGALGEFPFVVPPGSIPQLGPNELADRLRGGVHRRRAGGSVTQILCMEFVPGPGPEAGAWRVHARGAFWFQAPFGGSSCRSPEAVISFAESGEAGGISLRDGSCDEGSGRLIRGR